MSDFSMPDFSVPSLHMTDLSMPDIVMPSISEPDPALPALLHPDIPPDLDWLGSVNADMLAEIQSTSGEPANMPDDPLHDPSKADEGVAAKTDEEQLPDGLTYDALYTTAGLTRRERHLGMLLLGLEGKVEVGDAVDAVDAGNARNALENAGGMAR